MRTVSCACHHAKSTNSYKKAMTLLIQSIVYTYLERAMLFIGIDISKLTFDAAYLKNNRYVHKQFDNNPKGFKDFVTWIKKTTEEIFICLEATGIYSFALAQYLSAQKLSVLVVNPIIIHAFFKTELNRNKTDKADAKLIARYCEFIVLKGEFNERRYQPKGADYEAIQRLVTRCDQLEKSKTQESNRMEASANQLTSRSIKRLQKAIDQEIKLIKKEITSLVKNNSQLSSKLNY